MEKSALQWVLDSFRKFATLSGRASRAEYWSFYLLTVIIQIPAAIVDEVSRTPHTGGAVMVARFGFAMARRGADLSIRG